MTGTWRHIFSPQRNQLVVDGILLVRKRLMIFNCEVTEIFTKTRTK
jgi:hypothetical protein